MCSTGRDSIDRVTAAIDQLARDAQGNATDQELAAQVAAVWRLVIDLDPELARRARGYTTGELPSG